MSTNQEIVVEKALRKAFNEGQRYWQDADRDSYKAHDRAAITRQRFEASIKATLEMLKVNA